MDTDEALNRLVESLEQLLEEGRNVRGSLAELRSNGEGGAAEHSDSVRESFGDLVNSVSGTLEQLQERLRRMNDLLRALRERSP